MRIKTKKYHLNKFNLKEINKKKGNNNTIKYCIKIILFLCLYILLYKIKKYTENRVNTENKENIENTENTVNTENKENLENKEKKENTGNTEKTQNTGNKENIGNPGNSKNTYYCCFCSMAREENLYARELISYYKNLGVEKFVFGDNNLNNTEKLSDVLQDYINDGTVDILEIFGNEVGQGAFFGVMYEKYKDKCEWLTFFDFDEYLEMHFEEGKNLKLKEFLSNSTFDNCEAIEINWLIYDDNGLVHYDKRPSIERFTNPREEDPANRFVKSIVRGHLTKPVFLPGRTHHQPSQQLKLCNSLGEPASYFPDCIIPPIFKYAYLKHFNTRTAEEYAKKIKRGHPENNHLDYNERVKLFFGINEFTEEKLKVLETELHATFPEYHKN